MRKREREHVSIQSIGSALHQVLVPDIHELSHCSRYLKPQEVLAVGYCWMLYQFPFFIRALSFKQEIPPSHSPLLNKTEAIWNFSREISFSNFSIHRIQSKASIEQR